MCRRTITAQKSTSAVNYSSNRLCSLPTLHLHPTSHTKQRHEPQSREYNNHSTPMFTRPQWFDMQHRTSAIVSCCYLERIAHGARAQNSFITSHSCSVRPSLAASNFSNSVFLGRPVFLIFLNLCSIYRLVDSSRTPCLNVASYAERLFSSLGLLFRQSHSIQWEVSRAVG